LTDGDRSERPITSRPGRRFKTASGRREPLIELAARRERGGSKTGVPRHWRLASPWLDDRAGAVDGVATRSQLDGALRRRSGLRRPGRLEVEPGHVRIELPEVRAVSDSLPFASAAIRAREAAIAPTSLAAGGLGEAGVFDVLGPMEIVVRVNSRRPEWLKGLDRLAASRAGDRLIGRREVDPDELVADRARAAAAGRPDRTVPHATMESRLGVRDQIGELLRERSVRIKFQNERAI
jgi:hypothetical protein